MLAKIVRQTAKDCDSDPHFLRGLLILRRRIGVKIVRAVTESVIHGEFFNDSKSNRYGFRGVWAHWTLCCLRVTQTRIYSHSFGSRRGEVERRGQRSPEVGSARGFGGQSCLA